MTLNTLSVCVFFLVLRGSLQNKPVGQYVQFQAHDTNNDNCLEPNEFKSIFMTMDTYPVDGKLSVTEVNAGWRSLHFSDTSDVTFFFMEMDKDRDLYITSSDLDFLFANFDTDNDGCVTYDEYHFSWDSLFNE